ncbi:MAG: hypothetical protein HYV63_26260 [Candidatus Schekmanbacteria bacterium]|nr:hypothetical protein [Candidatus Schekmanbacteria bacterium]
MLTKDEIAQSLPPAGRYRVRVWEIIGIPAAEPREIELVLEVLPPPFAPAAIRDRFRIRGVHASAARGMHRLLHLLHLAGAEVIADTPLDLGIIAGLEALVDVQHRPGPFGFPFAWVTAYTKAQQPEAAPVVQRRVAFGRGGSEAEVPPTQTPHAEAASHGADNLRLGSRHPGILFRDSQ